MNGNRILSSGVLTILAVLGVLFGFSTLAYYAFAQTNGTVEVAGPNGTTIVVPQTGESGFDATLKLLAVVASIMGAASLILQRLPWKWARDAGELGATFSQKAVDISGDVAVGMMAMNAYTKGDFAKYLNQYGVRINDFADRFNAGNKQLQYLQLDKIIPKNPNYDRNMPRENIASNWREEGLPPSTGKDTGRFDDKDTAINADTDTDKDAVA